MTLRALKFIHGASGVGPFQCSFGSPPADTFAKLKAQGMYSAYVVRESDLEDFRKSGDLFLDRRRKHAAKPLAELLLGHKKIPLVSSGYRARGRLTQGIAALLRKAAEKHDRNLYIIGASDRIFEELWKDADQKQRTIRTRQKLGRAKPDGKHRAEAGGPIEDSMSEQLILELLPHDEIPYELQQIYVGTSVEAQLVRHFIMRAGKSDRPVLIMGDTGTGKEIVAREIHKHSDQEKHQFVAVNCSAIPRELLEAELFGTVKGGATNISTRTGLWELANEGTLFLDEIGDLIPEHQAGILRALEEGRIRRVGENRERTVRARIIAATNRDLFSMVQAGHFREDLYYRVRSFLIRTPTMHNHPDDIPILAQAVWKRATRDPSAILPKEIIARIRTYRWPGNVRELRSVLMHLYNLFGKEHLVREHLEAVFFLQGQGEVRGQKPSGAAGVMFHRVECLRHLRRVDEVVRACKVTLRPIIVRKELDPETIKVVDAGFLRRLSELELLCLRPVLFNSEVAFSIVYSLKKRLSDLHSLLTESPKRVPGYWRSAVAEEFELTLTAVFHEVERLTERSA